MCLTDKMLPLTNFFKSSLSQPPKSPDEMCYRMYCYDSDRSACAIISEQMAAAGTPCGNNKVRLLDQINNKKNNNISNNNNNKNNNATKTTLIYCKMHFSV